MFGEYHSVELTIGQLSYLSWGEGRPVLCLHGLADQGLVWRSLGQYLASDYCCIALDLPGHGASVKPDNPRAYFSPVLVTCLEEFIQIQGWSNVAIVAHSWAAKLALMLAKRHPEWVRQLVLVDPFFVNRFPSILRPTLPILYRTLPFLKMLGPFPDQAAAEQTARKLKQYQGWSALQQAVFETNLEPKADGQWGSKFAIAARDGVFLDTFQVAGLTSDIAVQTHVLLPEQGLNRQSWQIKPYRTYLSSLTLEIIPGNHWPHLIAEQEFNQVLARVLQ